MALWQKPAVELTFLDVDAYLKEKIPEGNRLDYKQQFPGDLAKTIAAFANTLGGMIILGVDSDKVTNEPIWPPVIGMPSSAGIADRIIQVSTEAIYPPVRVDVGQMENEVLPGCQIAIVRVDESRDAPHAVEKKRKVFVYERTDNKNDPRVLADIDRIKYLLDRRDAIESKREVLLSRMLSKASRELERGLSPKGWVSVAPVYPWRDLCRPSDCYEFLKEIGGNIGCYGNTACDVQRIPEGAVLRIQTRFLNGKMIPTDAVIVRADGIFLYLRTILTLDRRTHIGVTLLDAEQTAKIFDLTSFWGRIASLFDHAREFYKRPNVDVPGLLSLELGLEWMKGFHLLSHGRMGGTYSENEYQDSAIVPASVFLRPDEGLESLKKRLIYGFDFETPVGM